MKKALLLTGLLVALCIGCARDSYSIIEGVDTKGKIEKVASAFEKHGFICDKKQNSKTQLSPGGLTGLTGNFCGIDSCYFIIGCVPQSQQVYYVSIWMSDPSEKEIEKVLSYYRQRFFSQRIEETENKGAIRIYDAKYAFGNDEIIIYGSTSEEFPNTLHVQYFFWSVPGSKEQYKKMKEKDDSETKKDEIVMDEPLLSMKNGYRGVERRQLHQGEFAIERWDNSFGGRLLFSEYSKDSTLLYHEEIENGILVWIEECDADLKRINHYDGNGQYVIDRLYDVKEKEVERNRLRELKGKYKYYSCGDSFATVTRKTEIESISKQDFDPRIKKWTRGLTIFGFRNPQIHYSICDVENSKLSVFFYSLADLTKVPYSYKKETRNYGSLTIHGMSANYGREFFSELNKEDAIELFLSYKDKETNKYDYKKIVNGLAETYLLYCLDDSDIILYPEDKVGQELIKQRIQEL